MTPAFIEDYRTLAKQHPDAILLYRMGDFYEVFENVDLVASALGNTVTSRSGCRMVGCPYHSVENAIAALVSLGKGVAVAEYPQNPPFESNFQPRQVTRTYRPAPQDQSVRGAPVTEPQAPSTPSPAAIKAAREQLQLTQTQAASVVHCTLRAWQGWEAPIGAPGHRDMPPGLWELFLIKTKGA